MKPSEEELRIALEAAERMRQHDLDPHHLARCLRYLEQRNRSLEQLLSRTNRYFRFGMAEQHLTALKSSVDHLSEEDDRNEDDSEIHSSLLL